jgi:hypothetical protein
VDSRVLAPKPGPDEPKGELLDFVLQFDLDAFQGHLKVRAVRQALECLLLDELDADTEVGDRPSDRTKSNEADGNSRPRPWQQDDRQEDKSGDNTSGGADGRYHDENRSFRMPILPGHLAAPHVPNVVSKRQRESGIGHEGRRRVEARDERLAQNRRLAQRVP